MENYSQILKNKGYFVIKSLDEEVLSLFKSEITKIIFQKICQYNIKFDGKFYLENYHNYFSEEIHNSIWNKENRIFSYKFIHSEKIMNWLKKICSIKYNYTVLDIEKIGYPEVYFRIVRPNQDTDISGLHTDGSFYSITNNVEKIIWANWVKVWCPILFESKENNLGFFPESLNHNLKFIPLISKDKVRPKLLLNNFDKNNAIFAASDIGDVVYFSPDILHCAINKNSKYTRISIEFAIGPS